MPSGFLAQATNPSHPGSDLTSEFDCPVSDRRCITAPLAARDRVRGGSRRHGVGMAEEPSPLLVTRCRSPAPWCVAVWSAHLLFSPCAGWAGEEASNLLARECGLTALPVPPWARGGHASAGSLPVLERTPQGSFVVPSPPVLLRERNPSPVEVITTLPVSLHRSRCGRGT